MPRHCKKGVSLEKVIATWQHAWALSTQHASSMNGTIVSSQIYLRDYTETSLQLQGLKVVLLQGVSVPYSLSRLFRLALAFLR